MENISVFLSVQQEPVKGTSILFSEEQPNLNSIQSMRQIARHCADLKGLDHSLYPHGTPSWASFGISDDWVKKNHRKSSCIKANEGL